MTPFFEYRGADYRGVKQPDLELRVYEDCHQVAAAALELVLQKACEAIDQRGRFVLALAGGTTPKSLYQQLAETDQDWSKWHLIYGDERCLPDGHSERNSTMVEECWLAKVGFPEKNHHVPAIELTPAIEQGTENTATNYGKRIDHLLPIDLALLGMGDDGHAASLFPGHVHSEQVVVAVHNSPKPPSERISLSYATLCKARVVCFLVAGERKKQAVEGWMNGENLPVAKIHGAEKMFLLFDKAASSMALS
ncbi:MAG: 6-phosphogluconolactonase [Pseudomonadales bacterium]